MQKNYVLPILFLFVFSVLNAQTTLIQNTDNIVTATNSVACQGGDNLQARAFDLASFGVTTEFELISGEIGVQSLDVETTVTVNIYDSDPAFPTGFPGSSTLLGSQDVVLPAGSTETIIAYNFAPTIIVPASAGTLVVEVFQPMDGASFFIGGTIEETASSFIASTECGVATYATTDDIGFPDAHYYITVTGNANLSIDDVSFGGKGYKVYPNPTEDIFNIALSTNNELLNAQVVNLLGEVVYDNLKTTSIDISELPSGIYILNLETTLGSASERILRK